MEAAEPTGESVGENGQFWQAPQPYQAELAPEGSDIRTIKMIVSITIINAFHEHLSFYNQSSH